MEENCNVVENIDKKTDKNDINHIVISGGSVYGFSYYGILRESNKHQLWNINNIKTIYGTSIGSLLSVIISLKYDWDTLDEYLINRPWHKVYSYDLNSLINSISNCGIFTTNVMEDTLKPLLLGKDLNTTTTMKELYEYSNIELHIMATDLVNFKLIDFSYKTHPDWKVIDAVFASCSLPIMFKPIVKDKIIYVDGGYLSNYPIKECIENGADPSNILGIRQTFKQTDNFENITLFDYILLIINRIINFLTTTIILHQIKIDFQYEIDDISLSAIFDIASNKKLREEFIENGKKYFTKYLQNNSDI